MQKLLEIAKVAHVKLDSSSYFIGLKACYNVYAWNQGYD